jgi:hypothetical protein
MLIDVDRYGIYSNTGKIYTYSIIVRYMKDSNRLILLSHNSLICIDTKRREVVHRDDTYYDANDMMISNDSRNICIHEDRRNNYIYIR